MSGLLILVQLCMMGKFDMSKDLKLQRQKGVGGIAGSLGFVGPQRGPSTESQQSKCSLPVLSGSLTASPLLHRPHHAQTVTHQHSDSTGGTRSENKREIFKWSGVTVSFDAESVKIENEVNGAPPGIKKLGKEVLTIFTLYLYIHTFLHNGYVYLFWEALKRMK